MDQKLGACGRLSASDDGAIEDRRDEVAGSALLLRGRLLGLHEIFGNFIALLEKRGKLDVAQAVDCVIQACSALAEARALGADCILVIMAMIDDILAGELMSEAR